MDLLFSNYNPLKTDCDTFYNKFYDLFSKAYTLKMGVGFISQDSLAELIQVVKFNNYTPKIELVIGMHHFYGFENSQYRVAKKLNTFLNENKIGKVLVSTQFPYHGKTYIFTDKNDIALGGIIGSDNLGSIVKSTSRTYESSLYIDDKFLLLKVNKFINNLIDISTSIEGLNTRIIESPPPLDGIDSVEKIKQEELDNYKRKLTSVSFSLPLKTCRKSNLNVYFGKGRLNTHSKVVLPRPWYEIEIIVPKKITSVDEYPNNGCVFSVITDDGWKFKCKVSGDYSKNFRSEGNLSILGRWIKGRLENEGLLTPGEIITDDVLKAYGRNNLEFIKTSIQETWFLEFNKK